MPKKKGIRQDHSGMSELVNRSVAPSAKRDPIVLEVAMNDPTNPE